MNIKIVSKRTAVDRKERFIPTLSLTTCCQIVLGLVSRFLSFLLFSSHHFRLGLGIAVIFPDPMFLVPYARFAADFLSDL